MGAVNKAHAALAEQAGDVIAAIGEGFTFRLFAFSSG